MRTYKFELSIELQAVVPDQFLAEQKELCRADDATPFQRRAINEYDARLAELTADLDKDAEDYAEKYRDAANVAEGELCMAIIKNGLRYGIRHQVVNMLEQSGIGGKVAPVSVPVSEYLLPEAEDEEPLN